MFSTEEMPGSTAHNSTPYITFINITTCNINLPNE